MRVASGSAFWCVVLSLVCTAAWAAEPAVVFVDDARVGAKSIMVMDVDGANRTEVFRTAKRYGDGAGGPWLSPSISPDGQWVAYVYEEGDEGPGWAVWKTTSAGSPPQMLLCSSGPDGVVVLETPQWSPDGTEIAAVRRDFLNGFQSVVIIPADGLQCGIEQPEVVYSSAGGGLSPGVTWSPDGANLAVLESDDNGVDLLTVVPRWGGGALTYQVVWPAEFLDGLLYREPHALDWQRAGSLVFALDTYSESAAERVDTVWLLQVMGTTAIATPIGEGQSPTWAPDDSQLLFAGPQGLTRVTFPGGGTEFLGSGSDPDWKRGALAVCGDGSCEGAEGPCNCPADCDDPPSTETSCTDFADNDCDTFVDCDDTDCSVDPVCAVPYCGDGFCDEDESSCTCAEDCGAPLTVESDCSDGLDNDCDDAIDCDDLDCSDDESCASGGGNPGDPCTSGADCLSGLCHPVKHTCK